MKYISSIIQLDRIEVEHDVSHDGGSEGPKSRLLNSDRLSSERLGRRSRLEAGGYRKFQTRIRRRNHRLSWLNEGARKLQLHHLCRLVLQSESSYPHHYYDLSHWS